MACDVNPCTWLDDIWLGGTCQQYLQICDPTSPLLITVQQGLIGGSATILGQTASTSVGNAISAALTDPNTGGINWSMIALLGIVGFVLVKEIK